MSEVPRTDKDCPNQLCGPTSGQSKYDKFTSTLWYVEVCDTCGVEIRIQGSTPYKPNPILPS